MKEIKRNIWEVGKGQCICITTNGIIKSNGKLTMGVGVAKQAALKFNDLPKWLGQKVSQEGNKVFYAGYLTAKHTEDSYHVFSFPTKNDWRKDSDIELIKRSATQLKNLVTTLDIPKGLNIYLPRPGCGEGNLEWKEVKEEIKDLLPSNIVITYL